MIDRVSDKGLYVISSFGSKACRVHVGPYGTGKTFCLMTGFGLYCKMHEPGKLGYLLCGKTRQLAMSVMGDQLTELFGSDFKITSKRSDDPMSKDALLFNHRVYFGGMNDKESIKRVLGKSYKGVVLDELTSFTEEQFLLLKGRLRGDPPHFCECSTNPDGPKHWLKGYLDKHPEELLQWNKDDNITKGAKAYYDALIEQYKGTPYLKRYVDGEWCAADGLVYGGVFDPSYHVIDERELRGAVYRGYIMGVDFGSTNPTVGLLVGEMPGGEYIVIDEYYKPNSKNLDEILNGLINLVNKVKYIDGIYIDPSAALLKKELISKGVKNIFSANNDVDDGIVRVSTLFNQGRLFISSRCVNTIDELSMYAYKSDNSGQVIKENDHCMDALRYACMGRR